MIGHFTMQRLSRCLRRPLPTLLSSVLFLCSASAQWENLNPGGGGQIQGLVCDPNTPGRIFFQSDMEGNFRSDDYGESWNFIGATLNNGLSFTVAIEPGAANRVYAGGMFGLYLSNDAGVNWTAVNPLKGISIATIAIDPITPDNIYAGHGWWNKEPQLDNFSDPDQVPDGPRLLYFSRDRGATWNSTSYDSVFGNKNTFSINVDPTNADVIWVGAQGGIYRGEWNGAGFDWNKAAPPSGTVGEGHGAALSPDGTTLYASYRTDPTGQFYQIYSLPVADFSTATDNWDYRWDSSAPSDREYWRPVIDPRSTPTQHKLLVGTMNGGANPLREGTFNLSGGIITSGSWSAILDQNGVNGFNYDVGWEESLNALCRHYTYTPPSWDAAHGRKVISSYRQSILEGDPDLPLTSWVPLTTRVVGSVSNKPTYTHRGTNSTFNNDVAGVGPYLIQSQADNRAFESYDYGASWHHYFGTSSPHGDAVAVVPTTTPIVLISASPGFGGAKNNTGTVSAKRLVNYDLSDSWSAIGGSGNAIGNLPIGRTFAFAYDPNSPAKIYLAREKGLWACDDIEARVTAGSGPGAEFYDIGGVTIGTTRMRSVMTHPTNSNVLFASSSNSVWRGVLSGGTWSWSVIRSDGGEISVWQDGAAIYIATASGSNVFLSADEGQSWTNPLTLGQIESLQNNAWYDNDPSFPINVDVSGLTAKGNVIYAVASAQERKRGVAFLRGTIGTNQTVTWENWGGTYSFGNDSTYMRQPHANRLRVLNTDGIDYVYVSSKGVGLNRRAIGGAPPPLGGTLTFAPDADARVQANNPDNNYGASATLDIRSATGSGDVRTSFVRFTVAGIPAAASVSNASLSLYCTSSPGSATLTTSAVANQSWTEAGLTWTNQPNAGATVSSLSVTAATAQTTVDIDLAGLVTGNGTYTIAITSDSSALVKFASKEDSTNAPVITVDYVGGTPSGDPVTLDLAPTDDVRVQANNPTTNYSGSTALETRTATNTNDLRNVLVKFVVSGVPNGATIAEANLAVYCYSANNTATLTARSATSQSWDEDTVTWNTQPPAGSAISTAGITTASVNTWVNFDLTSLVTGNGTYSVVLDSDTNAITRFYSKENPTNPPEISVTYVP